jgi:glycosyltransferase involved in cell wall biosynthesis
MSIVSVVMTNYNYGRFIGAAIESVLSQTYNNFELVIVDDGSTDDSDKVINQYTSDRRINYHKQKNAGQALATNKGIELSKGEYIAFLDADDRWVPEKLAMQIPLFRNNPQTGVVYSSVIAINEEDNIIGGRILRKVPPDKFIEAMLFENVPAFSSSIIRKECFSRSGMLNPAYRVCTDYDLWLRIVPYFNFDCVEKPLIYYRIKSKSLSGNADEMFKTAHEITTIFISNNRHLINRRMIRKESLHSNYSRFYHYFHCGNKQKAIKYFWNMLRYFPFSFNTVKALIKISFPILFRVRK